MAAAAVATLLLTGSAGCVDSSPVAVQVPPRPGAATAAVIPLAIYATARGDTLRILGPHIYEVSIPRMDTLRLNGQLLVLTYWMLGNYLERDGFVCTWPRYMQQGQPVWDGWCSARRDGDAISDPRGAFLWDERARSWQFVR